MTRNLIFFMYLKDSKIGEFSAYHLSLINKYLHLFNGQCLIKIAVDDVNLDNLHLKNLFKDCSVEIVKNHPKHRESQYFIESIKEIKNKNSITFFAHNKGGSNLYADDAHKLWVLSMYFFNLEDRYLQQIEKGLSRDKVFSGILRKTVKCSPWVRSNWHYSGDFFWFHTGKLLEIPGWDKFTKGTYAMENYMGRMVNLDKSMSTFVSKDSNFETYTKKVWDEFISIESLGENVYQQYMNLYNDTFGASPENRWLGIRIQKTPTDLMILQDIIFEKRPDTIIECGTGFGGSAYYMASLMELLKIDGRVISIDHLDRQLDAYYRKDSVEIKGKKNFYDSFTYKLPVHPKLVFIQSDCLSADLPKLGEKVMVILDCDHADDHVFKELEKFSSFVTLGQYAIVVNTNIPIPAVQKFLSDHKNFVYDKSREKYGISSNLGSYLLKIS